MHLSVLLKEVVELLDVRPGGVYIDGTVGFAGHACAILERAGAGGRVLGIDKDAQALAAAELNLRTLAGEKQLVHGGHGAIARLAAENGFDGVDGILLDLGVSSWQLDNAERGFSFMRDGKLSMLMDADSDEMDAARMLAGFNDDELAEIFRRYGEEPHARRIARAIVAAREKTPILTTLQLADIVCGVVGRRGSRHPATRVFQAIRMYLNSEIEELNQALESGLDLLRPGGRMAVITFESLTDREVKHRFVSHAGRWISLQQGGERWEGTLPPVRKITRKPVEAGEEELALNPRARSARLRVVERLERPTENRRNSKRFKF